MTGAATRFYESRAQACGPQAIFFQFFELRHRDR